MNVIYDAIYLSPHLDDAALSCGGQIHDLSRQGKSVLIVTVMAGVPTKAAAGTSSSEYVAHLHERWQLQDDAVGARKAEDVAACEVLGADWQHWGFLDCIYRVDPETMRPFYTSDADIFGEIASVDRDLVSKVAGKIARLPSCNRLYVPLTLGNHVDHQLTRKAAEVHFSANAIMYYEDYPYARHVSASEFVTAEEGFWQPTVVKLSQASVAARIRAISCFESQISTFFKDQADLANQVRGYIDSVGGERLWKRGDS